MKKSSRTASVRRQDENAVLELEVLGGFRLKNAAGEIEVRGSVPRLLLAAIALAGEVGLARERASGLFWAERTQELARQSLRQALVALRAVLGERLDASGDRLRIHRVVTDALVFIDLAGRSDESGWERAAGLWHGPLLSGAIARGAALEEWLEAERRRLETLRADILYRLSERCNATSRLDVAVVWARQLVAADPTNERAQVLLMRALANLGERAAALQQYRVLCDCLWRELQARPAPATDAAYREIVAAGPDQPPAKPSLVLLPLETDGTERSALFGSGIAEELATILARIDSIAVIDRHAGRLADRGADLRTVAAEHQAQFLLCGAVRAEHDRLRISMQLLDARDLSLKWSERYDRSQREVFALQDEIADEVATSLQVRLTEGEHIRRWRGTTRDVEAWLLFIQGVALVRSITRASNHQGRGLLQQALARDPEFAAAWVFLGWSHVLDIRSGWVGDAGESVAAIRHAAAKALEIAPDFPDALNLHGGIELTLGNHDVAIAVRRRAVTIAPNHSESHAWLAAALYYSGEYAQAEQHIALAVRLSPFYPGWYPIVLGWTRLGAGRPIPAERAFAESCERLPDNVVGSIYLTIAQVMAGRLDDARRTTAIMVGRNPGMTIAQSRRWLLYRDPSLSAQRLDCLRRAGLPD